MMVLDPRKRRGKTQRKNLVRLKVSSEDTEGTVLESYCRERLRGHEIIDAVVTPWGATFAVRRWRPSNQYPLCPSEAWVDEHIISRDAIDSDGEEKQERFYQKRTLPPGMVRCPICERATPPIYLTSSGHCYDCQCERLTDLGASASLIDQRRMREAVRRGKQYKGE
jgi:hypothetical protein